MAGVLCVAARIDADTSKLRKEDVPLQAKAALRGKNKLCCGYPLVDDQQWALRFYWLSLEADYDEDVSAAEGALNNFRVDYPTSDSSVYAGFKQMAADPWLNAG